MTALTLTPEQAEVVAKMASEPTRAAMLAAETGYGKTLVSVELAKAISARTILLIGPVNRTVVNAWKNTFEGQGVNLPFRQITSKTQEAFYDLKRGEPGIYYVGREYFHLSATDKAGSRRALWSWKDVNPDLAVFDEVQTASNRNSNTYKTLKTLDAGYKVASSATPQGNRFQGLWSVCRWLWPHAKNPSTGELYVDNSFWRWSAEWAIEEYDHFSFNKKRVAGEREPGRFVNSLPCYIRYEAPKVEVDLRKVYVDLTPEQERIYTQMEADSLAWLDNNPLVAEIPIVQRIRLRQIALGEPTLVPSGENQFSVEFAEDCQSSKIDALHKIIDLHPGEPILVLVDSARFARVVTKRLGPLAREWSGGTSQKERAHILDQFGSSEVRFIVAVIPAVAEGVDGLQRVCNIEVWLNESVNEMLNTQAQGRLNRTGQKSDVIYQYKLIARNTSDDGHFESLVKQRIASRETLRAGGNK